VFGVGLIPLRTDRAAQGRTVLLMRDRDENIPEAEFEAQLLRDAREVRDRIVALGA